MTFKTRENHSVLGQAMCWTSTTYPPRVQKQWTVHGTKFWCSCCSDQAVWLQPTHATCNFGVPVWRLKKNVETPQGANSSLASTGNRKECESPAYWTSLQQLLWLRSPLAQGKKRQPSWSRRSELVLTGIASLTSPSSRAELWCPVSRTMPFPLDPLDPWSAGSLGTKGFEKKKSAIFRQLLHISMLRELDAVRVYIARSAQLSYTADVCWRADLALLPSDLGGGTCKRTNAGRSFAGQQSLEGCNFESCLTGAQQLNC